MYRFVFKKHFWNDEESISAVETFFFFKLVNIVVVQLTCGNFTTISAHVFGEKN